MKPSSAGWMFAAPALIVIGLFFGLPVIAALALSLTDFDKQMLANTGQELMEERAGVEHLLK